MCQSQKWLTFCYFVILSKAKNLENSYSCIKTLHFVQDDINIMNILPHFDTSSFPVTLLQEFSR